MKQYIHYGHSKYQPELVNLSSHTVYSKPSKGVWASPVDSDWGWKDWCKAEAWSPSGFDWSKSFTFKLTECANILEIYQEEDIYPYIIEDDSSIFGRIDFDRLYSEFDGIELFLSENCQLRDGFFYTWDCDSIVIWNPNVIKVV